MTVRPQTWAEGAGQTLTHVAREMNERILSWCGQSIGKLNPNRALRIKESILVTGRLDYPRQGIQMSLDTLTQVARLGACKKEPETIAWLERCMRPGDVFFDVGANVGAYSLVADSIAGGQSQIYAFEPSYSTFAALVENVRLNHSGDRIHPLQIALADATKLESFHYSSTVPGAAMHSSGLPANDDERPFCPVYDQAVLAFRLDDLITRFELPVPTHLKIDVDGAEWRVIQGAAATLARPELRSLLVEIEQHKQSAREIPRVVESHGFELVSKNERQLRGCFNYIFERRS